jgi:hypothetical protein
MEWTPFKEKLEIPVGGTFAPTPWEWRQGETEATSTAVNLVGCSAVMHVRLKPESTDTLLTLSSVNGRILLGGAAGTIGLLMTDEDTALISGWKSGVYDLKLTFPDGSSIFFVEGSITADYKVTRGV